MAEKSMTTLHNKGVPEMASKPILDRTKELKNVETLKLDGLTCVGSDALKEVMKMAPFSPGKQSAPTDSSLRTKLATIESNYSVPPPPVFSLSLVPISPPSSTQNDTILFLQSPTRPMSPNTESSSPRSACSPNTAGIESNCANMDTHGHNMDLNGETSSPSSSPRLSTDAFSEPSREHPCISPTESRRRSLQRSSNSVSRPIINLSNGSLRGSSGSSPFRDSSCSLHQKYTRTKSAGESLGDSANVDENNIRQKLTFV